MVMVVVRKMDVSFEAAPARTISTQYGERQIHRMVDGDSPRVRLDITGDVFSPEIDELAGLLELDQSELEIVLRRRPRSPQTIQAGIEQSLLPEPMTLPGEEPWRVVPQGESAKKRPADEPETQPEPSASSEPSTAQLVEEFGSWG